MRAEKWGTSLTAVVLGWLLAFGSAGSLLTAFDLPVKNPAVLVAIWGICALTAALMLRWKYGGGALLLLTAFLAGYIHTRGIAAEQFWGVVYRLTKVYDSAYGWGIYCRTPAARSMASADWVLGILGCIVALVTVYGVCRRKSGWFSLLCALVCVGFCVVVTDTVPQEIPLFCLMAGMLLLLLTAAVRQENETQGLRLTVMAAFPVVLCLTAIFLLFPQKDYVNRSEELRQELLSAARQVPDLLEERVRDMASGFQSAPMEQIDLSRVGPHDPLNFPVLEVTSEKGGTLYLRGQDFDHYTGTGWSAYSHRREEFFLDGAQTDTVTIHTRSKKSLYYLPYYPQSPVTLTGGMQENEKKEMTYRFSCVSLPESWRAQTIGEREAEENPPDMTQYLLLPTATRREAAELVEGLLAGTNTEKADRIAAMVCESAVYDLNTPAMPAGEGDFALWFLRQSDRGYCVHFATAATVLLRAAGVPARYVTGYLVDASEGVPVTATEEDAHAWAEYYEPLLGAWIPLEATPAAGLPETEREEPPQTVIRPTQAPAQTLPDLTHPEETQPQDQTIPVLPEPDPVKLTLAARILVATAAAILILGIQRSTRLRLRRRIQRMGTANEQALARWRETELLCRLLKESPDEELTMLAQKAKFSPHELTQEELARFDSRNRACLRQLRSQSWYWRLMHQYIYAIY